MALELKRITLPYECIKCDITKEILVYGDYYYEDDVDGLIVDFRYYYDMKQQKKIEQAQVNIDRALTTQEYSQRMRNAERDFLTATVFDRPLKADNIDVNNGQMPLDRR